MCGGGSSPSGETRYDWNPAMGAYWGGNEGFPGGVLQLATSQIVGNDPATGRPTVNPRARFTGERFAPVQYDQYAAGTNIRALNDLSTDPTKAMNAARGGIEETLGGRFLTGQGKNPYAAGQVNPYIGGNPYQDENTTTDRNLFAGNNPYFQSTMLSGMEDITDAYQRGTSADTTRLFNMSGAFGGSAHQNAIANNEEALGKNLSRYADSMLNQQYDRSAGLEDSFLQRDIGNQQFNRGTSSGLHESRLGRGFQSAEGGFDRGFQGFENERGRMMQGIGYGQNEQGLALGRAGAQMDWGNFDQGQKQQERDFQFDQWNQDQQYPFSSLDWLTGIYGRAQGGTGPTTTMYQGSGSRLAPYLGAGLAGLSFL